MFHFPLTIHEGTALGAVNAAIVNTLPLGPSTDVGAVILNTEDGIKPAGLYLFDGNSYRFCLPSIEISKAVIYGGTIDLYYALLSPVTLTSGIVYKNGILFNSLTLTPGSIYGVVKAGSVTGGVSSINGIDGNVVFQGSNGITVTTSGSTIELSPGTLDEGIF